MSERKQKRPDIGGAISGGVFFLCIGVILLVNTTGVVPWEIWGILWRFWPVLLIVAGLNIIFHRSLIGNILVGLLSSILYIAVVVMALILIQPEHSEFRSNLPWSDIQIDIPEAGAGQFTQSIIAAEDYTGVESRRLQLDIDSQRWTLAEADSKDYLAVDSQYYTDDQVAKLTDSIVDGQLQIGVEMGATSFPFFWNEANYTLRLGAPSLETDLSISQNSGAGSVDLSDSNIDFVSADVNSGSLELSLLSDALPAEVELDMNSGDVSITVDESVGIKLKYDLNSGSLTFRGNNLVGDSIEFSDNYDDAEQRITIGVNINSGLLSIE